LYIVFFYILLVTPV